MLARKERGRGRESEHKTTLQSLIISHLIVPFASPCVVCGGDGGGHLPLIQREENGCCGVVFYCTTKTNKQQCMSESNKNKHNNTLLTDARPLLPSHCVHVCGKNDDDDDDDGDRRPHCLIHFHHRLNPTARKGGILETPVLVPHRLPCLHSNNNNNKEEVEGSEERKREGRARREKPHTNTPLYSSSSWMMSTMSCKMLSGFNLHTRKEWEVNEIQRDKIWRKRHKHQKTKNKTKSIRQSQNNTDLGVA